MSDPTGTVIERVQPCAYTPITTRAASPVVARDGGVPTTNGWLSDTYQLIPSGATTWNLLYAILQVPTWNPSGGGTNYYFPGLVDSSSPNAILQPVLQFGESNAGGGDYWAIASWYVEKNGTTYATYVSGVNQGDRLLTSIYLNSVTGNPNVAGSVYNWVVIMEDETNGESQNAQFNLIKFAPYGALMPNAYPAVHESYGDNSCEDAVEFSQIYLTANTGGASVLTANYVPYAPTPQCKNTGPCPGQGGGYPACFYEPNTTGTTTWVE